jgi:hypothetical protein
VDEVKYLGVTFDSGSRRKRQKFKTVAKGNRILLAIDNCLTIIRDMRVKIVENTYMYICIHVYMRC